MGARIENNTHLKFIRDYLLEGHKKVRKTLYTYQSVLGGKAVAYDEQSPVHSRLKLSGVVKIENETLASRNRVYETVFDKKWVKQNKPGDKAKVAAFASTFALVLVLVWFLLLEPKFTLLEGSPLYYAAENEISFWVGIPSEISSEDLVRIKADGRKIPLEEDSGFRKGDSIRVSFGHLEVGENRRPVRFYGKKENFERRVLIVYHPENLWKPLTDLEMVKIPPGEFMMGSPEDEPGRYENEVLHKVMLTKGFEMQKTEVTQVQWVQVMGYNPSYFKNCGADCPVETVLWDDIQEFIRRLNKMSKGGFRLPTEAEWEYAARAGSQNAFANGDISKTGCELDSNLDAMGWYCGNSGVNYQGCYNASSWGGASCAGTHPVAQKDSNAFGLYDMHGNVWEWCQDWYGDYPAADASEAAIDPEGAAFGSSRVVRGGSWVNNAQDCRSAYRYWNSPGSRSYYLGFRLVRFPGQQSGTAVQAGQ